MHHALLVLWAVLGICAVSQAAEVLFEESFDAGAPQKWDIPAALLTSVEGRGTVLHIKNPADQADKRPTVSLRLPIEKLRGHRLTFGADVKTADVSKKPNSWNGVKVMMVVTIDGKPDYPQPDIPVGTNDWQRYSRQLDIPESAESAVLILGLEQVSGEAWFDNVQIASRKKIVSAPAADPNKPIYTGHSLPRLRGAMAGHGLKEEDIRHFAQDWNGNLFRWQFFESARQDRPLEQYDVWLDEQIRKLDAALPLCQKYGVMVVLDLHSPPGGQAFTAGYITARGAIFTNPEAQSKFVDVWRKLATHYKGNKVIWGYDLMNEPDDSMVNEQCLDWNDLALKTARVVHEIEPERTIIIEPNAWGGPGAFATFQPLDEPRIVYSYHMYQPGEFTHQGVHGSKTGVVYPGEMNGKKWDRAALDAAMKPARDFANKYRVHMYVGEFSAIRNAPENSAPRYLADVISLFEEYGYDWSYHAYREWAGWSVEHVGPLDKPEKATSPTDAEKVLTGWYQKNEKPKF